MGGVLRTGWPGVSRPVARGQEFMCCVRNPRNINIFVRVPGQEDPGTRPGGSVTGVTEKLFMCQMFMCLFRPLSMPIMIGRPGHRTTEINGGSLASYLSCIPECLCFTLTIVRGLAAEGNNMESLPLFRRGLRPVMFGVESSHLTPHWCLGRRMAARFLPVSEGDKRFESNRRWRGEF